MLSKNLVPVAAAYGLKPLERPKSLQILFLNAPILVESVLTSLMEPVDNQGTHICVSIDTEWNVSRRVGVKAGHK